MNTLTIRSIALVLLICCSWANADIFLPRLLSEGAVLQHSADNTLWGWANNGETVTIKLNGKEVGKVTTDAGTWQFVLPPQKPGGPHTLEFTGENTVRLGKIYFGDVWLASGQSNMEYPLNRIKHAFPNEIPNANNPEIKYFRAPKSYEFNKPKKDFNGGSWLAVTPQTAGDMSSVAWFFAKDVYKKHKIPIGIIDNSYGGSAVESWMSEEALATYPHYLETAKRFRNNNYLQGLINEDNRNKEAWWSYVNNYDAGYLAPVKWFDRNLSTTDWPSINIPSYWADQGLGEVNGVIWFRKEIILPQSFSTQGGMLELGRIVDADVAWINGIKVGETGYLYPRRQYEFQPGTLRPGKNVIAVRVANTSGKGGFVPDKPYVLRVGQTNMDLSGKWQYKIGVTTGALPPDKFKSWMQPLGFYNAMLAPVLDTSLKGVLWYQGESNIDRAQEYKALFQDLIRDWRKQFDQESLPFVFVQLPNYSEPVEQPNDVGDWTVMRAAQAAALELPNTAMVVTYDAGEWNDIHPLDKKTVGERVALAARKLVYSEDKLTASGPTVASMKIKGNKVRLLFDNVDGGLIVKDDPKSDSPGGFAIAGADGKYFWAETKMKKDYVEVWHDKVAEPKKIRYAWADNPTNANFYNKEGLPAPPFEIDVVEEE